MARLLLYLICLSTLLLCCLLAGSSVSAEEAETLAAASQLIEEHSTATAADQASPTTANDAEEAEPEPKEAEPEPIKVIDTHPVQKGPLVDLFGQQLLSLEMVDESSAELRPHFTSDALRGKKVIGVYFSADWCGPCRNFTPELVSFYKKMNNRRGKKDQFEIVWVSRCRDVNSYGQYFTHMSDFYALPPEEAMGTRGAMLSEKYKVKGIPTLVLLDDLGNVITTDARNKIPQDKAGIGFPWRNPLATLYMTVVPRSLRVLVKSQIGSAKDKLVSRVKQVVGIGRKKAAALG